MNALLTLVRHGRTAYNASRRFQGWADIPLDDLGHAQAARLARRLHGHEHAVSRLYTSDLLRTRQTAAALEALLGLRAEPTAELREIHVGAWEGRSYDEISAQDEASLERWPVTAAPGGESLGDVTARVRAFVDTLRPLPGEHVVLVTHGAAITGLISSLLGWDVAQAWFDKRAAHENTALTTFELGEARNVLACEPLACARHLIDLPGKITPHVER
ncbi:histidine phosphatase family protein [Deinococcus peraridilitoris]|uniref:Fructose-2,6-bisphosphatase n=1 Tax=Deinococcus peraridilitoris (strain DSM 19664 / LMG 22246 / CIP 109416 / KR-200) TaxID=937777 RepID=K9ZX14_DEIPD|nr:histidine phosphatase family protein [Deinococcus peraridilitoris]AFZ65729.1 fructose-2,6-bisphosphatase [Deinococcus peraridilitoris DSM 19664]